MTTHPTEFTIVFWNILFDTNPSRKVQPQAERYQDCARTLVKLGKQLDVVVLCETEDSPQHGKLGKQIAKLTGNSAGAWTYYDRANEQMGMFGKRVRDVTFVELGDGMASAMTSLGPVAIAGVHLTFKLYGSALRTRQMSVVTAELQDKQKAVVMGDFNSLSWQRPRKHLEAHGFSSVFALLNRPRPRTAPTKRYQRHMYSIWERLAIGKGFTADDIYVKGLNVKDAGIFEGESDHMGVWATLAVD